MEFSEIAKNWRTKKWNSQLLIYLIKRKRLLQFWQLYLSLQSYCCYVFPQIIISTTKYRRTNLTGSGSLGISSFGRNIKNDYIINLAGIVDIEWDSAKYNQTNYSDTLYFMRNEQVVYYAEGFISAGRGSQRNCFYIWQREICLLPAQCKIQGIRKPE